MGCQEIRDVHREAGARSGAGPRLTPQRGPWGSRFCRRGTQRSAVERRQNWGNRGSLSDASDPCHPWTQRESIVLSVSPRKLIVTRRAETRGTRGSVEPGAAGRDRAAVPASSAGMRQPIPLLDLRHPGRQLSLDRDLDRRSCNRRGGVFAAALPCCPSVLRRPAGHDPALDHFVASIAEAGDDRDDVLRGVAGE